MATKKDLFDEKKQEQLLREAIKKARAKKGDEFPFVFGMSGKDDLCVIDWKKQNDLNKLFLEMKGKHKNSIMGKVVFVSGDSIQIKVEDKKGGRIKSQRIKEGLRSFGIKKVKDDGSDGNEANNEGE